MVKTLYITVGLLIAFILGILVYDIFILEEPTNAACPSAATSRYSEEQLHAAYEMTRGMSRDSAAPMWHDTQLEQSLTDPVFVAELEAHLCRIQQMVGER